MRTRVMGERFWVERKLRPDTIGWQRQGYRRLMIRMERRFMIV